jgi:hypothetical protein
MTETRGQKWEFQLTQKELDTAMQEFLVDKRIAPDKAAAEIMINDKRQQSFSGDEEATEWVVQTMLYGAARREKTTIPEGATTNGAVNIEIKGDLVHISCNLD